MRLVLAAKSARDSTDLGSTSERLINLYPVPNAEGGRAQFKLRAVPGAEDFTSLPFGFSRAWGVVEGVLYIVQGGALWKVSETGITTNVAAVSDDVETTISGNRDNVIVSAAGSYNVWDGAALTQPGSGRIASISSAAFLDQFTLMAQRGGREIEWTEVGVPGNRNALYFRTAEARDDRVMRIIDNGGYLYALKETNTEVWGSTARGGAGAFSRVQGPVIETGLLGFNLVTRTPVGLFIVGHDRTAKLISGQVAQPLSTPPIDQALRDGDPTHCFYYEDRGQRFAVIRFSDRPAWVCDLSLGMWHERSLGVDHDAWDVIGAEFAYGRWHLIGRTGRIFRLGEKPIDASGPMRRTAVSREVYFGGPRRRIDLLELLGNFGASGLTEVAPNWLTDEYGDPILSEDGSPILLPDTQETEMIARPARIWIRLSGDGGATFGRARIKDIPNRYDATCRWRALGMFRRMVVEINMTDPVDFPLLSEGNMEVS